MTDWYRNTTWDADIETMFEDRLRRSRSQKAQYLRIQGRILAEGDPAVALALLERCVALQDIDESPRAVAMIGEIHLRRGDVNAAIAAFDRATLILADAPGIFTNAPADFCFLVAFHTRTDLYDRAWEVLKSLPEVTFGAAGYGRLGAMAVILSHRGDHIGAATAADGALRAALDRDAALPVRLTMNPDAVVKDIDNPFTHRLIAIRVKGV